MESTPVFLPGEFHGQRSLAGCGPWVTKSQTRLNGYQMLKARKIIKYVKKLAMLSDVFSSHTQKGTARTHLEVPQKIKNRTALWPSNSTSEHLSKEDEITVLGRCLYSDVHWSTIHNNEGIKQPKCPLMSNGKQRAYTHVHAKSLQLCPALCDPMDCSPPGSSVHGTLQAGILEWVAISFSRGSSHSRDQTLISCISCVDRLILYH